MSDVESYQPGSDGYILVGVAMEDWGIAADVSGDRARQPVYLAAGVPHVVDAAFTGWVAESPVLWLEPLVSPVRQYLTRFHAALRTINFVWLLSLCMA